MKAIVLSLIFLFDNGRIVPGEQMEGWADLPMTSMEHCLERSRFLYANPMPLPRNVTAVYSFCRREGEKPPPLRIDTF